MAKYHAMVQYDANKAVSRVEKAVAATKPAYRSVAEEKKAATKSRRAAASAEQRHFFRKFLFMH